MFAKLYDRVLRWSADRRAPWYLGGLSFAESSFFPIPPDVMLIPMTLAKPGRAYWFAFITTIASVAGGVAGYLIGHFAFDSIAPLLKDLDYWSAYETSRDWFESYGFWAVLAAGFSPIPYKVFTIAAGALAMNLPVFIAASTIGRGARFFLEAALVRWAGPSVEPLIRRYIEGLGWALIVVLLLAYLVTRFT